MAELPIVVCRVESPSGPKDLVTCLSGEQAFARGLPSEAILGELLRPGAGGGQIAPGDFAPNPVFIAFLHGVIARRGPGLPGLVAAALRQEDGWVYLIDQRTREPEGQVPPEDIVGAFAVEAGRIVPGSYRPSPRHLILSADGFFQLAPELASCLIEELAG